jgi:hypothetical protein
MAKKKGEDPKPLSEYAELKGDLAALAKKVDEALSILSKKENDNYEEWMRKAIETYKHRGTMVAFIETLSLPEEEKANFLDNAMTRAKGAPPKVNPFRKGGHK